MGTGNGTLCRGKRVGFKLIRNLVAAYLQPKPAFVTFPWVSQTHLKLNFCKTELVLFFPQMGPVPEFLLSVNGGIICPVRHSRHLGFTPPAYLV